MRTGTGLLLVAVGLAILYLGVIGKLGAVINGIINALKEPIDNTRKARTSAILDMDVPPKKPVNNSRGVTSSW